MKKIASGYRLIFGYFGLFLIVTGVICLLPLIMLAFYPSEAAAAPNFYIPGLCTIGLGVGLFSLIWRRERTNLGKHQDQVLLVLIWVSAIIICAIPFMCSGEMSFTESVFESTSGFATVGLTRFQFEIFAAKGYDKIYIFYRSLICFFGGIGLVLVVTSALSDRYGLRLYMAEGHNDKLIPNIAKSARIILGIYVLYIAVGTVSYAIAGMSWFDAINHSISAIATGGFSSQAGGILACSGNQTAIQIISCILMILGGTNFLIHFFLITGKFKRVGRDLEIRCFGLCCLILIPLFIISTLVGGHNIDGSKLSFGQSISYGTFTFISSISTTGFANVSDLAMIGRGAAFLVIVCCIIGGGMGSTAGGVKQYRFAIALKSFYWTMKNRSSSKRIVHPKLVYRCGEMKRVDEDETNEAYSFIVLYILLLLAGTFLILVFQHEFTIGDAMFEFANAMSSTGLSIGVTAQANNATLWFLTLGMFAGRLEFIPIFFAIKRAFRDILRKETY